ncbi:hypothetical protein PF008_g21622 [Phytophthora fragariae]|uniref:Uncharacterized protein n=1 Tax=Phytophthora fragariae TaxID=53985 RepID=A0A6G0QW21_9STRA|nr:hypothetical protein PF008_g21622 [Phytophthora fragariae]
MGLAKGWQSVRSRAPSARIDAYLVWILAIVQFSATSQASLKSTRALQHLYEPLWPTRLPCKTGDESGGAAKSHVTNTSRIQRYRRLRAASFSEWLH